MLLSLQGFPSIATKFIATTTFRCNKREYYHQFPFCGNRPHILPQIRLDVIRPCFVAIGARYYNKLHVCCNILALSRRLSSIAPISCLVAIEARYYNKLKHRGNICKHIATISLCRLIYKYCCKMWFRIATKPVVVATVKIYCFNLTLLQ
jgi:hypothetical protein